MNTQSTDNTLRIAIQGKGRLNEQSTQLLEEAGISIPAGRRKLLSQAEGFPMDVLYLRDDDIPQAVARGLADIGIVGRNEVAERGFVVEETMPLGFGGCRLSLAIPKADSYPGLAYFEGRSIATSYPRILGEFFASKGIRADIEAIAGSVEIAPTLGMADAIFDIVSSGGTLVANGLREVEKVFFSEAVLIATPGLSAAKRALLTQLCFRFNAILKSRDMKYVLMNVPADKLEVVTAALPGMRSPTVLPLAQRGWFSVHTVMEQANIWERIEQLKTMGAEGILVLSLEKMIR